MSHPFLIRITDKTLNTIIVKKKKKKKFNYQTTDIVKLC